MAHVRADSPPVVRAAGAGGDGGAGGRHRRFGSRALGPELTGLAAVFPVAFTGFALLVLPRLGGVGSAAIMASALRAMPGFALALLVLHLAAVPLGVAWALLAALGPSLAMVGVADGGTGETGAGWVGVHPA